MTRLKQGRWLLRRVTIGLAFAAGLMGADFDWNLPQGFPRPIVPADNPMSPAKVELGRYLFYDKRISVNGKESCASCHRQELAFTDGRARAEGTTGQLHPRNSMSLVNVAYVPLLTWANPTLDSLEEQALTPMLGEEPVELGLKGHEPAFLNALRSDPVYQSPRRLPRSNEQSSPCGRPMIAIDGAGTHRQSRIRQSVGISYSPQASVADAFSVTAAGTSAPSDLKEYKIGKAEVGSSIQE